MRISNVVAGFTLGEADLLRKAMGKKNAEVMAKMRGAFVDGAKKLGTTEKKAAHLFDLMEHFAGYGFNKSHSTAYAFLAYQTAYLKANYPSALLRGLLTIEAPEHRQARRCILGECRDAGSRCCGDINASGASFHRSRARGVRFGLNRDQERREGAIASLLEVRQKLGRIVRCTRSCEDLDLRLSQQAGLREPGEGRRRSTSLRRRRRRGAAVSGAAPRLLAAVDAGCEYGRGMQRDATTARPAVRRSRDGTVAATAPAA
jgi:DNA polymerase-3 subunit alpha